MESAIMNVTHPNRNRRSAGRGGRALLLLTAFGWLACSPTSPSSRELAARPGRADTNERVVSIRGAFVGDGSLEGHVDPFASSVPVERCRAEVYVESFPTEEFDANLVRVTTLGDRRYVADLQLSRADPRIRPQMRFEGFVFNSNSPGPLACADAEP
jgi:hypothetical protein